MWDLRSTKGTGVYLDPLHNGQVYTATCGGHVLGGMEGNTAAVVLCFLYLYTTNDSTIHTLLISLKYFPCPISSLYLNNWFLYLITNISMLHFYHSIWYFPFTDFTNSFPFYPATPFLMSSAILYSLCQYFTSVLPPTHLHTLLLLIVFLHSPLFPCVLFLFPYTTYCKQFPATLTLCLQYILNCPPLQ